MTYDFDLDLPLDLVAPARVIKRPAHRMNVGGIGARYGRANEPKAYIVHTPEEDADDREITPIWFENPAARAATHLYTDNDGDLYQMAAFADCPFAQGVTADQRRWKDTVGARPPWSTPGISLNCEGISNEVEGRAASIHHTLSKAQRKSLVASAAFVMPLFEMPIDRDHFVGHFELNAQKRDPGKLPLDDLCEEVFLAVVREPSPPLSRWQAAMKLWGAAATLVPEAVDQNGYAHYDYRWKP